MAFQPTHVCVVLPIDKEQSSISRCLDSIFRAQAALPSDISCDVVAAMNGKRETVVPIASELRRLGGIVVITGETTTGMARRLATAAGLTRFPGTFNRCWLANTEADCIVPKEWLLDQLMLAEKGVDAIAGAVYKGDRVGTGSRNGSHPHVCAANLCMRADAYIDAGGWSDSHLSSARDLWRRLRENGSICVAGGAKGVWRTPRQTVTSDCLPAWQQPAPEAMSWQAYSR